MIETQPEGWGTVNGLLQSALPLHDGWQKARLLCRSREDRFHMVVENHISLGPVHHMNASNFTDVYRVRSCSRQWTGFLRAMAAEFSAELPEHELMTLMGRFGQRFAHQQPLDVCQTLAEMEIEVNRVWHASDWGQCEMVEGAGQVEIIHVCAPINIALDGMDWSDGFLQGVYGIWFQQLGMPAGLAVRVVRSESLDLRRFVLSKSV